MRHKSELDAIFTTLNGEGDIKTNKFVIFYYFTMYFYIILIN